MSTDCWAHWVCGRLHPQAVSEYEALPQASDSAQTPVQRQDHLHRIGPAPPPGGIRWCWQISQQIHHGWIHHFTWTFQQILATPKIPRKSFSTVYYQMSWRRKRSQLLWQWQSVTTQTRAQCQSWMRLCQKPKSLSQWSKWVPWKESMLSCASWSWLTSHGACESSYNIRAKLCYLKQEIVKRKETAYIEMLPHIFEAILPELKLSGTPKSCKEALHCSTKFP